MSKVIISTDVSVEEIFFKVAPLNVLEPLDDKEDSVKIVFPDNAFKAQGEVIVFSCAQKLL